MQPITFYYQIMFFFKQLEKKNCFPSSNISRKNSFVHQMLLQIGINLTLFCCYFSIFDFYAINYVLRYNLIALSVTYRPRQPRPVQIMFLTMPRPVSILYLMSSSSSIGTFETAFFSGRFCVNFIFIYIFFVRTKGVGKFFNLV